MSLTAAVTARYGPEFLINLTNPQNPSATAVNATVLGAASDDVKGDIITYCGMTYDQMQLTTALSKSCISVAVEGVVAKLVLRTGAGGSAGSESHDAYITRLKALAKISGRDRVKPKTNSQLQPTPEQVGDEILRPIFDWTRFVDYIPNAPRSGGKNLDQQD